MPRTRALPAIPEKFYSVIGPISITKRQDLLEKDEAYGLFGPSQRAIILDDSEGSSLEHTWQTLWHEATHIALWDAGAHEDLKKDQEERVCHALSTYLTAMMRAGFLKVTYPKPRTK